VQGRQRGARPARGEKTELNKAIADLGRATGNSLKANNVEPKSK
jgi:hypothetical protein